MIQEEVLFQGTWAEALEHPEKIPADRQVRIIDMNAPRLTSGPASGEEPKSPEELEAMAWALADAPTGPDESDDPYMQLLAAKYRKQGLSLTTRPKGADDPV